MQHRPALDAELRRRWPTAAIHTLPGGGKVFTGQRAEGFYVDLGAIFDLGMLRPFQNAHLSKMPAAPGINSTAGEEHPHHRDPGAEDRPDRGRLQRRPASPTRASTIGVYATASRQRSRVYDTDGTVHEHRRRACRCRGRATRWSTRCIIPLGKKDLFNAQRPVGDNQFAAYVDQARTRRPAARALPGRVPEPGEADTQARRADLDAILLTGIPAGVVPGFQNFTGHDQADMLRLNMAIPPTTTKPSNLGLIGGDAAGFPNGRRVFDDVTTIELRAIAGATYPADRQDLQARRGRRRDHARADVEQHRRHRREHRPLPASLPLPRHCRTAATTTRATTRRAT